MHIDFNCDVGESFFEKKVGNDSQLIPLVTSCNIACGGHGGDRQTILNAVELAIENGVNIGAHPSYPDRENFGRKWLSISTSELKKSLESQVTYLEEIVASLGAKLVHLKPHGALYNYAIKDAETALLIATLCKQKNLMLLGMPSSELEIAANKIGVPFVKEVFADRRYAQDGSLVSRTNPNALLTNVQDVVSQCLHMVLQKIVVSENEIELSIEAESICVHGDTPNALELISELRLQVQNNNVNITPF